MSKLTILHGDYEKLVITPNPSTIKDEDKCAYKTKHTIGKYKTTETLKDYSKRGVTHCVCSSLDIPLISYWKYLDSLMEYSSESEEIEEIAMKKYTWV